MKKILLTMVIFALVCAVSVSAEEQTRDAHQALMEWFGYNAATGDYNYPDDFAGVWYDAEQGVLVVGLVSYEPDVLNRYIWLFDDFEGEVILELGFKYSYAELRRVQDTAFSYAHENGFPIAAAYVAVKDNRAVLEIVGLDEHGESVRAFLTELIGEDMDKVVLVNGEYHSYEDMDLSADSEDAPDDSEIEPERESESANNTQNPATGVIFGFTGMTLAGGVAILLRKRKD